MGRPCTGATYRLSKWFYAMYMVADDRRGVSAKYLAHELRIKWEAACCMLQRIRAAMAGSGCVKVLSGEVEIDDAYLGAGGHCLIGRVPARRRSWSRR